VTNSSSLSQSSLLSLPLSQSYNIIPDYETKNSLNYLKARPRKPLPIIEPGTGREIVVETDPFTGFEMKTFPLSQPPPSTKTFPNLPAAPVQIQRKPLPIINPKTGEIVTSPSIPTSPPQKRGIPIINPKTGAELENSSFPTQSLTSNSSNTNIIKTPITVLINRNNSTTQYPSSLSPSPQRKPPVPPQTDYPATIWSKSKASNDWPVNLSVSQVETMSSAQFPLLEIEEEEEEEEVDKYDWTPCLAYGMSFFDDEEPIRPEQRAIQGLNDHQISWCTSY